MKTLLVIGSHPDDTDYSCGGSLVYWHFKKSYKIIAVIMTAGERGGKASIRKKEAIKSLNSLGCHKIIFGNFKDTKIPMDYTTIGFLEKIINKYNPDIILTHSEHDKHQDHRAVNWATKTAARNVPQVLMYESPSVLPEFRPQHFVDISNFITAKMAALELHKSQAQREYMDRKAIESLAVFRGRQINAKYAEAYEVMRYRHD